MAAPIRVPCSEIKKHTEPLRNPRNGMRPSEGWGKADVA